MKTWAYALILIAATLWGIISIFVTGLAEYGFSTLQIVALRVGISAVVLTVYVAIKDGSLLRIRLQHAKYFIGTGVLSIAFFNWSYFTAIRETSVAVAAILLYTAPAFVLVLSRLLFGERLTKGKIAALAVTFCGCALVVGILPGAAGTVPFYGLAAGLGAGFGYALYSIFSKFALQYYSALTVTVYTFWFAAAAMLPVSELWAARTMFFHWPVVAYCIGFSFFSTILAYWCYTTALAYVEAGRAAIAATLEPIVATLVGILLFGEVLTSWQLVGVILVIAAVVSVQCNNNAQGEAADSREHRQSAARRSPQ
ncbi:DMT family transporter [Sporomusa termitida]|uniref:2A78: carboxylate/amino acid/amine transporter n=1 Tax=Sporomusa termitida TaxID=2377 RepID=A0A517E021_9FIRM|nr:EamA family transporter [Sporomusa termitida]QDR82950.1 2A78: carboxylate/amino acid/amine transporter [Sporomusa termitida]